MNRVLRIAGNISMLLGVCLGVPLVIAGAMLHAQADKRGRA